MESIERLINSVESEDVDQSEAKEAYKTITTSPNFHNTRIESDELVITTNPIDLHNPESPDDFIELGRLEIRIKTNGSYRVSRDQFSPRDASISSGNVHPHVGGGGNICQGNAHMMTQLGNEKDLAMLATFIYEFLYSYNKASTYWTPMFVRPCHNCEHKGTDRCLFCACNTCSNKRGEVCSGCRHKRQTNASSASDYIRRSIEDVRQEHDEDVFMTFALEVVNSIKDKAGEL